MSVPLERALSKLGIATRSQARALIAAGRVRVDGQLAANPLRPVVPEQILVEIDGRRTGTPPRVTVLLHKPRGVVTTRRDPEGRPTVFDLLHDCPHKVVPVGRLDFATSGLLLLTNDTRFADWVTDPAHQVPRVYLVTARGRITDEEAGTLQRGIKAGRDLLRAHAVRIRKVSNRESHLIVELDEGKNREVRRLLAGIGHEVTRLRRVQLGGLTLGDLRPGAWRVVEEAELRTAFPGAAFSRNKLPTRASRR